ncbi:DUF427 domain-containing protein [[Limnothrix rosea] IAM M-220]|uniref:DUF427 domain-containing protein n=1 Tax=[Limnothrix rosea] IAM M-220 TaxID=454133 RepID=UPI0009609FA6|nr:DUF427 domain-containing protein [[Limnothrix rosea] IAM M-220]OKH18927.1 hypothetical protein NIES208_04230 [[Limnothrix rosea] IAM M-220]
MFSRPQPLPTTPDQESVWDYPRPPRLEPCQKQIKIMFNGVAIAETSDSYRVLETSHPPVYYLPPTAIEQHYLQAAEGQSFCEWKGLAHYYNIVVQDKTLAKVGWYYPEPTAPFKELQNYVAFYAQPMDACYVDGEKVTPQPGGFYGGWITKDIIGPFKGEPGSFGW